jgi:hypothetical protein
MVPDTRALVASSVCSVTNSASKGGRSRCPKTIWLLESGEVHALPGTDDVGANGGLF